MLSLMGKWKFSMASAHPPTGPWSKRAACRGLDPDLFFRDPGESAEEAIAVCRICPVAEPCLQYALDHPTAGVWGGTTQRERARIRRARGRVA